VAKHRVHTYGALLTFVCAGIFMVYLDSTVVNVALPKIQASLGGGVTELQWVVDAYALALASLLLTSGAAGDIVGRRRMFLLGLVGFTVSSVACALSTSIDALLIARAVQGAVGAGLIPISLALITQLYTEPAKRAAMIGLWAGIGGLALAAGPVIGGALLDEYGWESIFWINVPIGVLSTLGLFRLLPDTQVRVRQNLDPVGQVLFIVAIGLLTYGLIEGNGQGWTSLLIIGVFAGAAVTLAAFLWWQVRTPTPLLPLSFFRNVMFAAACAVNFLGLFGLFGIIFLMTLYLQTINGLSPIETGIQLLALTVSIMVASAIAPMVAKRLGTRTTVVVGSAVTLLGCLGLTRLAVGSGFGTYAWALALLGIGVSLCGAPATIALLGSVPADRAGTASGVSNTFRQIGGVFGVAMAGAVVLQHLKSSLTPVVSALPIPDGLKQTLVDAIGRGDVTPLRALPAGLREAAITRAQEEFVNGMHIAAVIAGAGGLVAGVVALIWMGRRATPVGPVTSAPDADESRELVHAAGAHW
jgi:EmrB/QacA subfamily drug resistance transporter